MKLLDSLIFILLYGTLAFAGSTGRHPSYRGGPAPTPVRPATSLEAPPPYVATHPLPRPATEENA